MNNSSGEAATDPGEYLQPVIELAREAGRRILEIYGSDFSVAEKDDRSPLTAADMASHQTLVAGLGRIAPRIPVLSEESAALPFAERARWQQYWLVDPLDGTKEFIKRNGEFTVNVALIRNAVPVLGVVHVPVSGRTYYASRDRGAFREDPGEAARRIHARRLAQGAVTVVGSRSHRGDSLNRFLDRLGDHEITSMGSSLKFCLVAEGRADVYPRLGPTSEWDTAAAQCVVEEAGGRVVDLEMRRLRYNTRESLLNPHFIVFGDDSCDWSAYL
jgi:3'(2'), 5'-bisphosphate nucleotidase